MNNNQVQIDAVKNTIRRKEKAGKDASFEKELLESWAKYPGWEDAGIAPKKRAVKIKGLKRRSKDNLSKPSVKSVKLPKNKSEKLALDKLVSEYIRKRAMQRVGGCERCLSKKVDWKSLQWAHFHSRKSLCTRWSEDNSCGLCGGCHMYLDSHPVEKVEFFQKLLGENRYTMLTAQLRNTWPKPDKSALILYYQEKIRELDGR